MVRLAVRREGARYLQQHYEVSERRACRTIVFQRATLRYRSHLDPRTALRIRMRDIADHTITVTQCGRICFGRRKINLSTVFAGQNVGVKEVSDRIWLVSFMDYHLGFFDHETGRLGSAEDPFAAKVLPMCPV